MVRTASVDGDAMPKGAEQRIGNKLRLMRQTTDMRLMAVKSQTSRVVEDHVANGLARRRSQDAIQMATLAAYREAVAALATITSEWPGAV